MINAIDISKLADTEYENSKGVKMRFLENIKKVNIFVGENNSGKSRMLRSLLTNSNIYIYSNSYIDSERKEELKNKYDQLNRLIDIYNNYSKQNISKKISKNNLIQDYICFMNYFDSLRIDNTNNSNSNARSSYNNICQSLDQIQRLLLKPNSNEVQFVRPVNASNIIYIPILRGVECFDNYFNINDEISKTLGTIKMNKDQNDALEMYKNNVKHIYKNKVAKSYGIQKKDCIFTAEELYDEITNKLLGQEDERNFVKNFEKFISEEFYNNEGFTIIPNQRKGVLIVKIGNCPERELHNLGDGIKQLITILYKIYEFKDKTTVFLIEEPEINLHPGYQRKLIEILQSNKFPNHQYFITTHSNHIIDSCLEDEKLSIFKFDNKNNKNNSFVVTNTSSKDVDILNLLGVNNSSVFLSNCTIWVEGISDKILISKYLSVYLKSKGITLYKEDIHYSFIEYGGNNITHWSFIDNDDIETINASGIANKSFIICDNDDNKAGSAKRKRKDKLHEIFKENFYELKVREIENTIKRTVLEKTLFNGCDIKIKKNYDGEKYANQQLYMGRFIDNYYDLSRSYATSTGSVKNKLEFSKKISSNINSIEDLSENAIELCEKLVNFIKESNDYEGDLNAKKKER